MLYNDKNQHLLTIGYSYLKSYYTVRHDCMENFLYREQNNRDNCEKLWGIAPSPAIPTSIRHWWLYLLIYFFGLILHIKMYKMLHIRVHTHASNENIATNKFKIMFYTFFNFYFSSLMSSYNKRNNVFVLYRDFLSNFLPIRLSISLLVLYVQEVVTQFM